VKISICPKQKTNFRTEFKLEWLFVLGVGCTVVQEFSMETECLEQSFTNRNRDKLVLEE